MRQGVLSALALGLQGLVIAAVRANPIEFRDGTPPGPCQPPTKFALTVRTTLANTAPYLTFY